MDAKAVGGRQATWLGDSDALEMKFERPPISYGRI